MITETYKIAPTNGEDLAALADEGENIALREELGLEPVKRKDENAGAFVFRRMTEEENKVFSFLFPQRTKVEAYPEYIPTEALEALKEFNDTCPYLICDNGPQVWHAKEYDPDPILACSVRTENDEYTFANAIILIARWGEALLPFDKLQSLALEKWRAMRIDTISRIKREAELAIEDAKSAHSIGIVEQPTAYHLLP